MKRLSGSLTISLKVRSLLCHGIFSILFLVLLATVSCRTYTPQEMKARYVKFFVFEERHTPKKLRLQLVPGTTREQVYAFYARQPMSSHLRSETGWTAAASGTNAHIFEVIGTYEWLHDQKVQRCDVFESPVGHSFMQLLPDIDYVFFDASDKSIGFHHEIVGD